MVRVAELSKDVAQKYRESKKDKLKRTFVSASNAAESKISKCKVLSLIMVLIKFCFLERLKPDPNAQNKRR